MKSTSPVKLWDEELEAAREQIRAEAKAFVAGFPADGPDTGSPTERAQARRVAESAMILRSEKGVDRTIAGPAGPLRLREFRPSEPVEGAMLHIHGGGWMTGEPELTDLLNEALSASLNLAIVSVEYRLAPEHPYPAGPDDCEAAALWLIENAAKEYGTDRLVIGGESAGAHLSAVTLLRLRDRHGAGDRFCGANLVFGVYDLGATPSAMGIGMKPGTDILDPDDMRFMVEQFAPGLTAEQRRQPDLSPLYAELGGMPPACFMVGTADHLLDDTLFFADRWVLAGNQAELLVYPHAPHGGIGLPTVLSHWWPRLEGFLRSCLENSPVRA
jgi:acetyl esterase/lipase